MVELRREALSRENPWPGLDPFDEADQGYFHGRDVESGELLRLVRRETLTVLFGRSGLGKTSLLKAGLSPRLREEDGLPVYLRLDHAEGAPDLREQVFRGLQAACEPYRIQAAPPAPEEGLWSYFHRRDAEFWSEHNRPVTPVILLDQFEEIFTLGQETDAARARSAAFLAELGDLVENRPPEAVSWELEADPTAARRLDFKRSSVKLVLSFREDFLAEMEGLKERIPSLMYNRFRLLAMNGAQAYSVTFGDGHLVDDEIARRILRLTWKNEPSPPVDLAEFPKIEIDPALLSVVCSELNHKRKQAKPPLDRITAPLLEGADREILSGFYERSMAGLDPRVRAFVEDELITGRGYRNSHALEDALALPGVTSGALDALIRRRLLRIDERQSVRRLELTHDVLTRVVKESRDSRHAREAQRRNRRYAAFVAAGALVVAVLIGLFLRLSWKASQAEKRAQETLREAERARMVANADWLQETDYGASLLVNLAAVRIAPTFDAQAALLRRLVSHPHLSTFLRGHRDSVRGVAFSPDGRRLASASWDKTVILWDVAGRRKLATLEGHRDRVACVAFSPDGKWLASAGEDRIVILWDLGGRKPTATPLKGHKDSIFSVAFSPDGKRLASAGEEGTVLVWDVVSRQPLAAPLEGHRAAVRSVAFSPDGGLLASGSEDMSVILWDARRFSRLTQLKRQHEDMVNAVAFSPDGEWLASGSEDQTVILWDVASREPLDTLEEHQGAVYGIAFSPDGTRLASASDDQTVVVWDMDRREPLATLEGHQGAVNGVAFSPDGTYLASAASDDKTARAGRELDVLGQTVILWNLASRKLQVELEGSHGAIDGVAFSPDGKRLVSKGDDETLFRWDVASRKLLDTTAMHDLEIYRSPGDRLLDPMGPMGQDRIAIDSMLRVQRLGLPSVVLSPDGKLTASARGDGIVILTEVGSDKPLATLEGHEGRVRDVAFSSDGKRLASGGADGKVILWNLGLGSLEAEACRTANRNLTCEEWRSYISTELSYQKSCGALLGPETCE